MARLLHYLEDSQPTEKELKELSELLEPKRRFKVITKILSSLNKELDDGDQLDFKTS